MRSSLVLTTTICAAALAATPASAAVIFKQTFDNGLGANESVSGNFSVADGKVGHATHYDNGEYSYYQIALDLTGLTNAVLSFDYGIDSEMYFDGFNVLGSTDAIFNAATDLLTPNESGVYGKLNGGFVRLGDTGVSGKQAGVATIDLSQFAGQTLNLRFQFQADRFAFKPGVQFDNVTVSTLSAVPEPATWAMMILGFGAVGTMVRTSRRRCAFNPA